MFQNMTVSLLNHEIIKTTLPKAKELRRIAEPLITMARNDSVHKRRVAFSRLRDRDTVTKLFNELGPRYKDRPGGYTRILKTGFRAGDNAPLPGFFCARHPQTVGNHDTGSFMIIRV